MCISSFCTSLNYLLYRLEHDKDNSRETSDTYVVPRLFPFITAVIWGALAAFFRRNVRSTIHEMCPHGHLAALGGRVKRNIQTLGIS